MKKRLTAAALALCMLLTIAPVNVWAAETEPKWGETINWNYDTTTKTLTISGTGAMPGTHPYYKHTDEIQTVSIDAGVTEISSGAFRNCKVMTAVTIPASVTKIGDSAFSGCEALASVTIPNGVTRIEEYTFYNCTALTNVTIPNNVTAIGQRAFDNCQSLASVTIPDGVTIIEPNVFWRCRSLTSISIPAGVTEIRDGAFLGCNGITEIELPEGLTVIGPNAFDDTGIFRVTIPKSVTTIGGENDNGVFGRELTTVYIPKSAVEVDSSAFSNPWDLKDVYYEGTEEEWKQSKACISIERYCADAKIHYEAASLPQFLVNEGADLKNLITEGYDTKAGLMDLRLSGDISLTESLDIPSDTNVRIDLNGHEITSSASPILNVGGTLTVIDSTAKQEPVVDTAHTTVPNCVTYTSGSISAGNANQDAVLVDRGGSFTLESGTVKAANKAVVMKDGFDRKESEFQIKGGYVEAGKTAVTLLPSYSKVTIGGGVLLSKDGPAIFSGNEGNEEYITLSVRVDGGTLISQSTTSGQLPCGIYQSQRGSTSLDTGAIYAEGGIGVLARGGYFYLRKPSLQGEEPVAIHVSGTGKGKVGNPNDTIELEAGHAVVLDQKSFFNKNQWGPEANIDILDFEPLAYPADGYILKPTYRTSGVSPWIHYQFREPTIYTLTLNPNGGTLSGSDTVKTNIYQRLDKLPDDPTRDGYVFKGWSQSETVDLRYLVSTGTEFTGNRTLYAVWVPETAHIITFEYFYETSHLHALKATDANGVLTDWPDSNISIGGTVLYWHNGNGMRYTEDYVFTEDTTVYAKYASTGGGSTTPDTPLLFVSFDANGGIGSVTVDALNGRIGAPREPYRTGYTFTGWYTQREGGDKVEFPKDVTKSVTVYAHWTETVGKTCEITFDPNGGTGGTKMTTGSDGKLASLPANPTREGDYRFTGWYFYTDGGEKVSTSTVFAQDTTVYANWSTGGDTPGPDDPAKVTVTFDSRGGSIVPAQTITSGQKVAKPTSPTRSNYTFGGWFRETACENEWDFEKDSVTGDITLYAKWVDKTDPDDTPKGPYTITLDPNGGILALDKTLTTGTDGTLSAMPKDPTRSGYTFLGWYTEKTGGTEVTTDYTFTADATIYAHWERESTTPPSGDYYDIEYPGRVTGGTFEVSHDRAKEGTRITIELSPRSNYELDELEVVNADTGRAVRLTERYADEYTFSMPDSDVEIYLSYQRRDSGGGYYVPAEPVIPMTGWYYQNGRIYTAAGEIVPDRTLLTRDMLLSILYNREGGGAEGHQAWATKNGIVPNYYEGNYYGTDKPLTREQAAMILYCYARYRSYNTAQRARLTGYSDYGQIRPLAQTAMSWARGAGLMTGTTPTTLSPTANLTCGQACVLLSRFAANVSWGW